MWLAGNWSFHMIINALTIRFFTVRMKKPCVLSYPLSAQRRYWSDWADAQADLSLHWAHTHFVGFVMSLLIFGNKVGIIRNEVVFLWISSMCKRRWITHNHKALRDLTSLWVILHSIKTHRYTESIKIKIHFYDKNSPNGFRVMGSYALTNQKLSGDKIFTKCPVTQSLWMSTFSFSWLS